MYGLSDGGELELQLQKFEKDSCSVLYHFPLDHDFGAWQYAISPTGKIAWWSKDVYKRQLITHLTKKTMSADNTETTQELHFLYDANNHPAMMKYDGKL